MSQFGINSDRRRVVIVYGQATECHFTFVRQELDIFFGKITVLTIKIPQSMTISSQV